MKAVYKFLCWLFFLNKKKVIGTLWFDFYNEEVRSECGKFELVFEPESSTVECPSCYPRVRYTSTSYEVLTYIINSAIVNISTGIYYLPKSANYVEEFSSGYGRFRTNAVTKLRTPIRIVPQITIKSRLAYVVCHRGFHGIIEDISAILLISERQTDLSIVIDCRNRWVINLLELFDYGDSITVVSQKKRWIGIDNLIALSKAPLGEFVHPKLVMVLREKFVAKYRSLLTESDLRTYSKVFISRADSAHRQSRYENDVQSVFESKGFKVVKLSEYSVAQQAVIMGSATEIAGVHGAGFVNMLWNPSCSIIEIYDSEHFNFCYSYLASLCGHNYRACSVSELLNAR